MQRLVLAVITVCLGFGGTGAVAEQVGLNVVLSPTDISRFDVEDGSGRFVLLSSRQGTAEGDGYFENATVVEFALHDVVPGVAANALGYLEVITENDDIAYFKWTLEAQFIADADGKTTIANSGTWTLAGGTGRFAGMRGVGAMNLEFVSDTDRRYLLTGVISPSP